LKIDEVTDMISSLHHFIPKRAFCQLQQLQCLHYGSTNKAYLLFSLFSIPTQLFVMHTMASVQKLVVLFMLFFVWNVI